MWQLARCVRGRAHPSFKGSLDGKLVWVDGETREPCGVWGCPIPSIRVNTKTLFGDYQVMHLDTLELLPTFARRVPLWRFDDWCEMDNAAIEKAGEQTKGGQHDG